MFSPARYFPPTYFAPRMFGGVAGSVTPTPTPTPTGNHRYSFGALKTAAKQAIGGNPSANLDLADAVNDALAWLCTYHPWTWLRRPLSLDYVADQAYVVLPADFKRIVSLARSVNCWPDVQAVTVDQINAMRSAGGGVLPVGLYYCLGFASQASPTDEPLYRLELYPTPSAAVTGALVGTYERIVPALVDDAALPDIPAPWHPALKSAVRAQAKNQQFDETSDDWQIASGQLDVLKSVDGSGQPSLGRMVGAVGRIRGQGGGFWFSGTIVPPT